MEYKFTPNGDAQPLEPYVPLAVGQPARRIGRRFDPVTQEYPLSGKPYVCKAGSREALRCAKLARRGDLLPADQETASALGLKFEKPGKGGDK